MPRLAAETAAVAGIAVAVIAILAWPVLRAPSERLFGLELVGRHPDPFTVMAQFGRPVTPGVYFQPATDVPGALVARMTGPVAAYNWIVLLTFPLAAATAFLLARHLHIPPAGAALAALAFAFSPFHLAQAAYHPHIAQTQWLPLYLLALFRAVDSPTVKALLALAAAAAAVTLSNFYGGLIAAVVTPVALAGYWWCTRAARPRPAVRLLTTAGALVLIAGVAAAGAWYVTHDVGSLPGAYAFPRSDLFLYSAKWWSYLVPPAAHPWLGAMVQELWRAAGVHEGLLEQQVSLGWGVIGLAVVGVAASARRGRPPILRAAPALAAIALAALACSLSPERTIGAITIVRPSAALYALVPMFRSYARFGVVVQLMATLLAGMGAVLLWRSGRGRIPCLLLVGLAAAEYAVAPALLWRDVLPSDAHRWLVRQPGRVQAVDCAPVTTGSASVPWLSGGRITLGAAGMEDCAEPDLADKLAAAGYTHLLVRRNTPYGSWMDQQPRIPGFNAAVRFADADVFTVIVPPPVVYTREMTGFYPREYDAAWTWRWMARAASWRVRNTGAQPVAATVSVEVATLRGAASLDVALDGHAVRTLEVAEARHFERIGPILLPPGDHELTFRSTDPPGVAGDLLGNGDPRALSFRIGGWRWHLEEVGP